MLRTKAGSTVIDKSIGRCIAFDWLEEGGCCDCVPYYEHCDDFLHWECEKCGGGSAELIECPTERKR